MGFGPKQIPACASILLHHNTGAIAQAGVPGPALPAWHTSVMSRAITTPCALLRTGCGMIWWNTAAGEEMDNALDALTAEAEAAVLGDLRRHFQQQQQAHLSTKPRAEAAAAAAAAAP